MSVGGAAISNYGTARFQSLVTAAHPDKYVSFAGRRIPGERNDSTFGDSQKDGADRYSVASYFLNLNGIQFAVQFIALLFIGPYADYGTWRPWLLICRSTVLGRNGSPCTDLSRLEPVFECVTYISCFALAALSSPSQWLASTAIHTMGGLALNIANTYYYALLPVMATSLPEIIESERKVFQGEKTPEHHQQYNSLTRAKVSQLHLHWCL